MAGQGNSKIGDLPVVHFPDVDEPLQAALGQEGKHAGDARLVEVFLFGTRSCHVIPKILLRLSR